MNTGWIDVAGTGFAVLDRVFSGNRMVVEGLGGSCGNVLWSLAMLNRSVVPVLSLGADEVADELVAEFEEAGADTTHIARRDGHRSPVLVQHVDVENGKHWFSRYSPETAERYPPYTPIRESDVEAASSVLHSCSVFYADRASEAIVDAIERTAGAGGIVFFEPSEIGDAALFRRAIAASSIVKFSRERLGHEVLDLLAETEVVAILTSGDAGLEVHHRGRRFWCEAIPADDVKDTSGAGDMVSVGIINRLVTEHSVAAAGLSIQPVLAGVRTGQRLAAANCSFVGARGLFRHLGATGVRDLIESYD